MLQNMQHIIIAGIRNPLLCANMPTLLFKMSLPRNCFFGLHLSGFPLQPRASAILFLAGFTLHNRDPAFFGINPWKVCVVLLYDLLPCSKISNLSPARTLDIIERGYF
jgi:hypothetical protein